MSDDLELPDGLPSYGLTGLGAIGLVWALGPSVRAFGRNLGQWTDYHTANLLRLSSKVSERRKLTPSEDEQAVHPRVAKEILDAAAWIDDDLHQEYLAGLVVDSRSPGGADDGLAFYTRLVAGLTASQIRVHHAMYSAYLGSRLADESSEVSFTTETGCSLLTVSAQFRSWQLCASNGDDSGDPLSALSVAIHGLRSAGLISSTGYGSAGTDRQRYQFVPTLLGATLFGRLMFAPAIGPEAIRWDPLSLIKSQPPFYPVPAQVTYPPLLDVRIEAGT